MDKYTGLDPGDQLTASTFNSMASKGVASVQSVKPIPTQTVQVG